MIITLLNLKGGVGKTTLSIHLASTLSLAGKKVMLIDADAQQSAIHWAEVREDPQLFTVAGIPSNTIHKQVQLLKPDYDFIIIDGPPRISNVSKSAIVCSDLVLIPINPSPYDVWASSEIIDLLNDVKSTIPDIKKIKAAFVINRKIQKTVIGRDVQEALQQYGIPILTTAVHQRVSYAESAARGSSVIEEDPESIAGKEIKELTEEVLKSGGYKNDERREVA